MEKTFFHATKNCSSMQIKYFSFSHLRLTSRGMLYYLCIVDLSKSFSQLIGSIFIFSQYFFNKFCPVEKCGVTPHCFYRDSLTLNKKILLERRYEVNYFPLIYRYGINTNLLHLTFSRAEF